MSLLRFVSFNSMILGTALSFFNNPMGHHSFNIHLTRCIHDEFPTDRSVCCNIFEVHSNIVLFGVLSVTLPSPIPKSAMVVNLAWGWCACPCIPKRN